MLHLYCSNNFIKKKIPTNSRIFRQVDQNMLDLIESDFEKNKVLGKNNFNWRSQLKNVK